MDWLHTADYDEPWYDETNEETFRPHSGALPADPTDGIFLVRATAVLADGTTLGGFLTPAEEPTVGDMQPHVFVKDAPFGFWGGIIGVPEDVRSRFHGMLGKPTETVFPIRIAADEGLARGATVVTVSGWPSDGPPTRRKRRWPWSVRE